jgi:subtilisin
LEVVSAALAIKPTFFNARTLLRGAAAGLPEEMIGYDCSQYEAPMVMASLTDAEIDALRKNGNVAAVEDDLPCYALGSAPQLLVEGQPSPLAETVPAGIAQIRAPAALGLLTG